MNNFFRIPFMNTLVRHKAFTTPSLFVFLYAAELFAIF